VTIAVGEQEIRGEVLRG